MAAASRSAEKVDAAARRLHQSWTHENVRRIVAFANMPPTHEWRSAWPAELRVNSLHDLKRAAEAVHTGIKYATGRRAQLAELLHRIVRERHDAAWRAELSHAAASQQQHQPVILSDEAASLQGGRAAAIKHSDVDFLVDAASAMPEAGSETDADLESDALTPSLASRARLYGAKDAVVREAVHDVRDASKETLRRVLHALHDEEERALRRHAHGRSQSHRHEAAIAAAETRPTPAELRAAADRSRPPPSIDSDEPVLDTRSLTDSPARSTRSRRPDPHHLYELDDTSPRRRRAVAAAESSADVANEHAGATPSHAAAFQRRLEAERLAMAKERANTERAERSAESARLAKESANTERLAKERATEHLAKERATEHLATERANTERLAKERAEAAERLAKERAERAEAAERLAKERAERAEAERLAEERSETEDESMDNFVTPRNGGATPAQSPARNGVQAARRAFEARVAEHRGAAPMPAPMERAQDQKQYDRALRQRGLLLRGGAAEGSGVATRRSPRRRGAALHAMDVE